VVSGWFICSMRICVRCAERNRRRVESTNGAVCRTPFACGLVEYSRFSFVSSGGITPVE